MIKGWRWFLLAPAILFHQEDYAQGMVSDQLYFEDYFETFDKQHWTKASHTFENNLAYFSGRNLFARDGRLHLKLTSVARKGKQYSGAEIRTRKGFKYGKFVARLKPAKGSGIISGFFLYDTKGRAHEEIDIEFTGKETNLIHFNHWVNKTESPFSVQLDFDAANSYHEYSILWLPDYICWEIDGKEVYRTNTNIPHSEMKLMFNIWASKTNSWTGALDESSLPATIEIDYIKIYSYKE
ncbi:family 16 glycosylhydrolase [Desertivirga brevis]|uniref:family 16 glycosylhydrolase n=1 Tax=Desertivirga brevis TaxID=2810310 RepID=UPI001A966C71|nr:family 16 glycosylhydrolase [Pedobacter sp. SYSU D00873]